MKKIIKIAGLLFIAAMFAGCQNAAGGNTSTSNSTFTLSREGLFPVSDTPDTMSDIRNITIPDGTWKFKSVWEGKDSSANDESDVKEFTFTKSGTTMTITSGSEYYEGIIPAGTPQDEIDVDIANGYVINGNHYSYLRTWDSDAMTSNQEHIDHYFGDFYATSTTVTLKKNADNTKFYSKEINQSYQYENNSWLMKL